MITSEVGVATGEVGRMIVVAIEFEWYLSNYHLHYKTCFSRSTRINGRMRYTPS